MDKILIIDDNNFELAVLNDILKEKYEIITAKDGHTGFELALKEQPSLILLDIVMPQFDGFQTLELILNNPSTVRIPVIFLTAIEDVETEERGFLSGVVDYIKKPYNPNIVLARVKNQIKIHNYQRLIESQLSIDGLTGVHNRRDFQQKQHDFWNLAKEKQTPLSIMILDIDFFKRVNDTYGHMTGDNVLCSVATAIDQVVSEVEDGYVARYGGEEFVVFLPDASSERGQSYGEKIRLAIEALNIPNVNSDVCPVVTISIGGNTIIPDSDSNINSFLAEADSNLYNAKQTGRNRVIWS